MTKLPQVFSALAAASLVVAPIAAQAQGERPGDAAVNVDNGGKKRCQTYTDPETGETKRKGCGGFLWFGGPLGLLAVLGITGGGIALVASSGNAAGSGGAESP